MASDQVDSLAENISKISVAEPLTDGINNSQGRLQCVSLPTSSLTINADTETFQRQEAVVTARSNPPTLLTIPSELRNAIFSYVYDTVEEDHIILLRFESSHQAGVEEDKAPPTKAPLLVCQQLYHEQNKMQAAAYRRYWTHQRFFVVADGNPLKALHLATAADLRHIRRLAVHRHVHYHVHHGGIYRVIVNFRFQATTGWTVDLDLERLAADLREHARQQGFLQNVKSFINQCMGDPIAGQGLTVKDLEALPYWV